MKHAIKYLLFPLSYATYLTSVPLRKLRAHILQADWHKGFGGRLLAYATFAFICSILFISSDLLCTLFAGFSPIWAGTYTLLSSPGILVLSFGAVNFMLFLSAREPAPLLPKVAMKNLPNLRKIGY